MSRLTIAGLGLIAAGLLVSVTACNLLVPVAFLGETRKKIEPEFDKLPNRRVVVLVWTDPSTLFDYPYARFELASYVANQLRTEMGRQKHLIDLVDPRDVEDFIQRNAEAQTDPMAVGREFRADYVISLEILRFQMRDPRQPELLQGHIEAAVTVFDPRDKPEDLRRYELRPVSCVHPEAAPVILTGTNAPLIRQAAYEKFARLVARKFHEYTIET